MNDLVSLLDDHQRYHSDFQIDHFIIARSGGTKYGMYKQALRELDKRTRALRSLYANKRPDPADEFEAYDADDRGRVIADTEREFLRFYAIASALKREIGELTPERRRELDEDMWRHRLKSLAAVELLCEGRVGRNTLEFIMATPKRWRNSLVEEIRDHAGLMKWFNEFEAVLPEIPALLPSPNVRALLGSLSDGDNAAIMDITSRGGRGFVREGPPSCVGGLRGSKRPR